MNAKLSTDRPNPGVIEVLGDIELNLTLIHDYKVGDKLNLQLSQFPEATKQIEALMVEARIDELEMNISLLANSEPSLVITVLKDRLKELRAKNKEGQQKDEPRN